MRYLLLLPLLVGCAHTPYIKIGGGLKLNETNMSYVNKRGEESGSSKISARIEGGFEVGCLSYGLSHHSQYLSGWPFNDNAEYYKTEIFIDYKFTF